MSATTEQQPAVSSPAQPWVRIGPSVRRTAQIQRRAAQAARGFELAGVAPGDVVAVLMRNDFAMVEATWGAGLVGAYVVPVNFHNTADEVGFMLRDSGAKVLVVHADLLRAVSAAIPASTKVIAAETPEHVCLAYQVAAADAEVPAGSADWETWLAALEPKAPPFALAPGSMFYTSGTTGRPKGVRRKPTPERVADDLAVIRMIGGLNGYADRMHEIVLLIPGPAYHSSPNAWLFALLKLGANLCIETRFDPESMLALIARERVTHVLAVPTMFVRLLGLAPELRQRYDVSSLVHVMHVGAPCPPHVKRAMIDWWGPVITEHYGSTEVGPATYCTAQEWLAHPGTVGRVVEGTVVQVLDEAGQPAPPGTSGEIACQRESFTDFIYHGDPDKRARAARGARGEFVATGDLGYFDADGFLFLVGRDNDMIISGGSNIYPIEIENAMMKLPGVADCAVFGIPDADYGEQVCAFVQARAGAALDAEALRGALRSHLAGYKIPRRIEIVDALPREDTGKIFKRKLRDPFWAGTDRSI